jgi:hypothetical protein
MPRPCRSPAMPFRVNSHMPCRAPVMLRQCRVLRESPRGSRKYLSCYSNILMDRLLCSLLLPFFTVVDIDRCEEGVIIACGLYLLAEEERIKRKYWIYKVF